MNFILWLGNFISHVEHAHAIKEVQEARTSDTHMLDCRSISCMTLVASSTYIVSFRSHRSNPQPCIFCHQAQSCPRMYHPPQYSSPCTFPSIRLFSNHLQVLHKHRRVCNRLGGD